LLHRLARLLIEQWPKAFENFVALSALALTDRPRELLL
jgi:hypothetical protein